jgi:hypothetical protein
MMLQDSEMSFVVSDRVNPSRRHIALMVPAACSVASTELQGHSGSA